jgi:hypothetical protein
MYLNSMAALSEGEKYRYTSSLTQHFFTKDLQFVYHSFALFCYFIRKGVLNNEYSKDIELYN